MSTDSSYKSVALSQIKDGKITFPSGVFYVPSSMKLVESLFEGPTTARGTFKILKGGIMFRDGQGVPEAFLVTNPFGENFFVSCHVTESGKTRYMHSTTSESDRILGIGDYGVSMRFASELSKAKKEHHEHA